MRSLVFSVVGLLVSLLGADPAWGLTAVPRSFEELVTRGGHRVQGGGRGQGFHVGRQR